MPPLLGRSCMRRGGDGKRMGKEEMMSFELGFPSELILSFFLPR